MRNIFFTVLLFSTTLLSGQVRNVSETPSNNLLHNEAIGLLTEWMDAFLNYQCDHPDPALNGGILCPACARMHGRIGDAVLPLMYLADKTGNPKYLNGAKQLMAWMENVHRPDGSWMNDVHVSDWNGTTVFASIALYEALRHHGHLLDDSTRNHWKQQLLQAGEFMMKNPFIYSRKREGMRNMNVNYSASATYALYAIGEWFDRPDFKQEAQEIAAGLKSYFTKNEGFLYGEGPNIYSPTPNGCFPIDLLYNVEESLPNMAYYATMAGDKELLSLVERSMSTHLEFMLPDGAWDNSWGTRSFKWTYWGGRTSDGFMGGYYALATRHPEYVEAILRNVRLLKKATCNGLLHGGMHYSASGIPPCIHHTFGHAKALASFLDLPLVQTAASGTLPRDAAYGTKYFKDIHTWLLSYGDWRSTLTGYDAEYKVKGTHPMGGALSMFVARPGRTGLCRNHEQIYADRSTQHAKQHPQVPDRRHSANGVGAGRSYLQQSGRPAYRHHLSYRKEILHVHRAHTFSRSQPAGTAAGRDCPDPELHLFGTGRRHTHGAMWRRDSVDTPRHCFSGRKSRVLLPQAMHRKERRNAIYHLRRGQHGSGSYR